MKKLIIPFLVILFIGCSNKETKFTYYGNGAIKEEITFNKKTGEKYKTIPYFDHGQMHELMNYKNGKMNGDMILYYENGQIKIKCAYKDDEKNGECITYYENGQIEGKGNFKNGEFYGEWILYNEDGTINKKETYKDGELISSN